MKPLKIFIRGNLLPGKCLPLALAAMAFLLTGCPHNEYNEYVVELKPQGDSIGRTLVFYRTAEGETTNCQSFDTNELAAIIALYPAHSLTNTDGRGRYTVHGVFTNKLPADVGGVGTYAHLATTLGDVSLYVERFRGNDDLGGMLEEHMEGIDQLVDLVVGWSQMELGRKPGYGKLRQFLNVDFRRDLKNLVTYSWEGEIVGNYTTNATKEFGSRSCQYLYERGYFTVGEIPGLFRDVTGDNTDKALKALLLWGQRLVARKMGVPETESPPLSLAFLADLTTMKESLDKYLASTDLYRAKIKEWKHDKKRYRKPEPLDVAEDALNNLRGFDIGMGVGGHSDHLVVRLSLPSPPATSNGRWDEEDKQVVWDEYIEARTNAAQLPVFCYASWAQANEAFQTEHFGKVALTGDALTKYCLWRSSQDAQQGGEWDAFLAGLQPSTELVEKIDSFRFTSELKQAGTNDQQEIQSPSAGLRKLLKDALK
jgi:hypothetical protein